MTTLTLRTVHRQWLCFAKDEIASFESLKYRPILEYGGWGIRMGKNGKAYTVSGDRGVRFVFTDKKKLLIGTQNPEKFQKVMREMIKKS
jgi:hypothetical protein